VKWSGSDGSGRPLLTRLVRSVSGIALRKNTSTACWLCAVLAVLLLAQVVTAQELDERTVKVADVFNLTKYVEWPHPGNQLVIGYLGDGPMGEALEKMLAGKTSGSRPIRVMLLAKEDSLDQCDLIYIAYSSPRKVHAALEQLRNKSVLTVGETDVFPTSEQ
jgi:hypothetical protein